MLDPAVQSQEVQIWAAIQRERRRQDGEWGGPDHDDQHSAADWVAFTVKHLGRTCGSFFDPQEWLRRWVAGWLVVAALAVAAILWGCRRMESQVGDALVEFEAQR